MQVRDRFQTSFGDRRSNNAPRKATRNNPGHGEALERQSLKSYELLKRKELEFVWIGRAHRVVVDSSKRFVEREREKGGASSA